MPTFSYFNNNNEKNTKSQPALKEEPIQCLQFLQKKEPHTKHNRSCPLVYKIKEKVVAYTFIKKICFVLFKYAAVIVTDNFKAYNTITLLSTKAVRSAPFSIPCANSARS
jgi:hypothetical protein